MKAISTGISTARHKCRVDAGNAAFDAARSTAMVIFEAGRTLTRMGLLPRKNRLGYAVCNPRGVYLYARQSGRLNSGAAVQRQVQRAMAAHRRSRRVICHRRSGRDR